MNWFQLRNIIRKEIEEANLKSPKTRIGGLESVDELIRTHFPDISKNPSLIRKISKEKLKAMLSGKKGRALNGAEESIVNNIYKLLDKEEDSSNSLLS